VIIKGDLTEKTKLCDHCPSEMNYYGEHNICLHLSSQIQQDDIPTLTLPFEGEGRVRVRIELPGTNY
jgi:hypothetical protein